MKAPTSIQSAHPTETRYTSKTAFATLYENTHSNVYRYVYGLIGGPAQDAEDITAETYLKAWNARHKITGDDQQLLSWLFTIAKRLVIDRWRKHKRHPQKVAIDHLMVMSPDATPEERATLHEQGRILASVLNQLADEKREMIVLRYMLNWSVNRIAEHLGKKPNTVSVAIHRELTHIRTLWDIHADTSVNHKTQE